MRIAKAFTPVQKAEWREVHTVLERVTAGMEGYWRGLWGSISLKDAKLSLTDFPKTEGAIKAAFSDITSNMVVEAEAGFVEGAQLGMAESSVSLSFDLFNPLAAEWAFNNTGVFITEATEDTIFAIRDLVTRGIRLGENPNVVARDVQRVIGLHSRQATAMTNYRRGLVEQGIKKARVQTLTDQYARRALRQRATTIARTEMMAALNQGQRNAWNIANAEGLLETGMQREYIANPNTNHGVCEGLDGTLVDIDGEFPLGDPPIHPRCVCSVGLRLPK